MEFKGLTIGFALTGSFCTVRESMRLLKALIDQGAAVIPIISGAVANYDTRFTEAEALKQELVEITGNKIIETIMDAEPIGPKALFDALIVSPCTGNTVAKIANAITDTTVTMAVKAHLRNQRPVIIAIATNDGLGANAKNIGALLNMKNIYFVPFYQDDPAVKANSLVSKNSLAAETIRQALLGKQLQPVILQKD